MAQGPIKQTSSHSKAGASPRLDFSQQGATTRTQNEEATVPYIKRVLRAKPQQHATTDNTTDDAESQSLDALLPPLTSSNAVDVQLYAFIAVIISNFVQTWYNRITPDQHFVAEVVQIIAHCTRGLEQRLRHVDLENLVLDELPALLDEHVHSK